VGDDRAETYLRLLAETELRRVPRLLGQAERRPDGGSDPAGGLLPDAAFRPDSDIAHSAAQLGWVGDVLVAAGVLANDRVSRIVAELDAALTARARSDSSRRSVRLNLALERIGTQRSGAPQEPHDAAQSMQVTPIGRKLRVAGERAPSGHESPARRGDRGALPTGGWDPGFSWWVRDDDGNWHVGTPSYRHRRDCGQVAFRVRLTPQLGARPHTIEVAVTGPATRIHALVPVREAPGCRTLDT
jgi:hypothetical protein